MSDTQERSRHPLTGRTAVVEDDGDSAWLLLTHIDGFKIAADCWLYNRRRFAQSELATWPRDRPPPAPDDFIDPRALRNKPLSGPLTFVWDRQGESVAVRAEGTIFGFIAAGEQRGYSQYLRKVGPWGAPFDARLYRRLFESDGPAALTSA